MSFTLFSRISRIRYRLALALVSAALLPVLVATALVETTVRQTSARFFVPEVGEHLDRALGVYQELARSIKEGMQHSATAIASNHQLREAAQAKNRGAIEANLRSQFLAFPRLTSLSVVDSEDRVLARADRGTPLDPQHENALTVNRPLTGSSLSAASPSSASGLQPQDDATNDEPDSVLKGTLEQLEAEGDGLRLVAVFAAQKAQLDAFQGMSRFVDTYHKLERRRESDDQSYVYAFATLLGLTILAAVGVGILLARGVTGRVSALATATSAAAAGDLSVRVRETGEDEITDLAKGFNRMLAELETNRARIEYLQRMESWQEMARRLAHEIKNPLTPIQLAVQDIHRRYSGPDREYQQLLDTTLEIVEDEVGTLRRLVSEFSNFARLPQSQLGPADLGVFLQEQQQKLAVESLSRLDTPGAKSTDQLGAITFDLPHAAAPVWLDRQMLRRAFLNLVENAKQALGADASQPKINVSLKRDADFWMLVVEDNGPGIPEGYRSTLFDPYVTTKSDGAGLGLAIVKKIVVDHGGRIAAGASSLGGAKISIWLPAIGTHALESFLSGRQPPSSPSHPSASSNDLEQSLELNG